MKHHPPIKIYSGIEVDSPEALEEVLRLLDSLSDIKPRTMLDGITRLRVRQALEKPKKTEQRGRIIP